MRDEVVLNVPASADHVKIVRVGAAAIALRKGMSFAAIDALRSAIDTAMLMLLDATIDADGAIACVFRDNSQYLELELRRSDEAALAGSATTGSAEADDASGRTAATTVDIDAEHGVIVIRMSLTND